MGLWNTRRGWVCDWLHWGQPGGTGDCNRPWASSPLLASHVTRSRHARVARTIRGGLGHSFLFSGKGQAPWYFGQTCKANNATPPLTGDWSLTWTTDTWPAVDFSVVWYWLRSFCLDVYCVIDEGIKWQDQQETAACVYQKWGCGCFVLFCFF